MTILFVVLLIVAAVLLGVVVLIQNPKGGGLAGNIAGLSSQFMGVKQTNDVLERGTWIFTSIIALLCLFSVFFISGGTTTGSTSDADKATQAPIPGAQPGTQTAPLEGITPQQPPVINDDSAQ